MSVVGVLPAAGTATRMRGLPKFLLPLADEQGSLLEYHIRLMAPHVEKILVPTRTEWIGVLRGFGLGSTVVLVEKNTDTLAQTVSETLAEESYDHAIVGLPDTFFMAGNPYAGFSAFDASDPLVLACFPTRHEQKGRLGSVELSEGGVVLRHADKSSENDFGMHWGAMRFSREVGSFLPPAAATVGVLIDECLSRGVVAKGFAHDSDYYDCGTVEEYARCLATLCGVMPRA
jgi:NDP-sugar pyrophosphorylase family protein